MSRFLSANDAASSLSGSISPTATTAVLATGTGALFPNPGAGEYFVGTFRDAATELINEIVWVTQRVGDTITMIRAREGTTGVAWDANDLFDQLWTAGQAQDVIQETDAQAQTWNYAADVGSANAYQITLDPPLTVPVDGMPVRMLVANTNTGPSTLNAGAGAISCRRRDGTVFIGGEFLDGEIVEVKYDGTFYRISDIAPASDAVTLAQTDAQTAVTPASLKAAFPFDLTGSDGYVIFPGGSGTRLIIEWGQVVANSGASTPVAFSQTMTGGLLAVNITANFVTPDGVILGQDYVDGGGTTGFTLHNRTGGNGNYNWIALGRI